MVILECNSGPWKCGVQDVNSRELAGTWTFARAIQTRSLNDVSKQLQLRNVNDGDSSVGVQDESRS